MREPEPLKREYGPTLGPRKAMRLWWDSLGDVALGATRPDIRAVDLRSRGGVGALGV